MKQTNTPYEGTLTIQQQEDLLCLLWGSMKRESGYDRVHTGWGTKTQTGLLKCIESIIQKGQVIR